MTTKVVMPSGSVVDLAKFSENDIDWEDIAIALSRTKRFRGAGFSVLEHSLLVGELAKYWGRIPQACYLIHDAAEAYLGDIITPVKAMLPGIRELEDTMLTVIYSSLGLSCPDYGHMDKVALVYEYCVLNNCDSDKACRELLVNDEDILSSEIEDVREIHTQLLKKFPTPESQIAEFCRRIFVHKEERSQWTTS